MSTHLRMYDKTKTAVGLLPDHVQLQCQTELNGPGTLTFGYRKDGFNAGLFDTRIGFLEVIENGVPNPDWFILEEDGDDPAEGEGEGRPIMVSARGIMAMLEWAVVYPELHVPNGPVNLLYPQNRFINKTPGAIMLTLIQRAQARGALSLLNVDFTATKDSSGQAWPTTYTQQYDSGMDYLTVLQGMLQNGWADARTSGFTLQMFVPDTTLGTDKPNCVLYLGQNVLTGPRRKRSRKDIRSVVLGVGADRVLAEAVDANAEANWLRREGSANDGRAISYGTMQYVTQAALKEVTDASEGFTVRVAIESPPGETWKLPNKDFFVGDRIRYDQRRLDSTTFEPLRVRTITYGWDDATSDKTCSIELNDVFAEYSLKLKQRVDTLLNGISQAPLSAPPPAPLPNPTPPSYPAAVLTLLGVTDGPGGVKRNAATVSWPAVTTKTDGLPYNDSAFYLVSFKQGTTTDDTGWSPETQVDTTYTTIENLTPGLPYLFRVRAVDLSGNKSAYTYSSVQVGSASSGPPLAPSIPTVTQTNGVLRVSWDGKSASGGPMDPDLQYVEVQVSVGSNTGPWTTFDSFPGDGTYQVSIYSTNGDYTSNFYFRLVAHNYGPDSTAGSASAGAQAAGISASDIGQKVLSYKNFSFTDAGNLIGDGAFETLAGRNAFTRPSNATFVDLSSSSGGYVGGWVLRHTPGSSTMVMARVDCKPGDEFFIRRAARGNSGANGTYRVIVRYYDKDGGLLSQVVALPTPASTGAWIDQYTAADAVVAPANAIALDVAADTDGTFTTGTWDSDAWELRLKVGTLLVRNAAITTALINDLAVTNAKISDLSVGKLTAGKLTVDVGVAGRLLIGALNADGTLVSPTGARLEITSAGIKTYNASNQVQVNIGPSGSTFVGTVTGSVFQTRADNTKARIVIDPVSTENSNGVFGIALYGKPYTTGGTSGDQNPAYIGADSITPSGTTGNDTAVLQLQAGDNGNGAADLNLYPYSPGLGLPLNTGSVIRSGAHLLLSGAVQPSFVCSLPHGLSGGPLGGIGYGGKLFGEDGTYKISFGWDSASSSLCVYVNGTYKGSIL